MKEEIFTVSSGKDLKAVVTMRQPTDINELLKEASEATIIAFYTKQKKVQFAASGGGRAMLEAWAIGKVSLEELKAYALTYRPGMQWKKDKDAETLSRLASDPGSVLAFAKQAVSAGTMSVAQFQMLFPDTSTSHTQEGDADDDDGDVSNNIDLDLGAK